VLILSATTIPRTTAREGRRELAYLPSIVQVEHQLALRGLLVLLAADSELLTALNQLPDDDGLVRRFARNPVSGMKIDPVEQIGFRVLS
jgi:hypothetical protein